MERPVRQLTIRLSDVDEKSFRTDSVLIRIETRVSKYRMLTKESVSEVIESIGEQLIAGYELKVEDLG